MSLAARESGFKVQVHVISEFRSYHVTSIFSLLALPQHQHTSFLCPDVSDRIALPFFKELLNKGSVTKSSRLRNEKTERNQKQSTIWKNDKIVR